MYGGRVIDDFDRRVVNTYMDEYMGDFIFDTFQPFHFYMNDEVCLSFYATKFYPTFYREFFKYFGAVFSA